jgi:MFS family permease
MKKTILIVIGIVVGMDATLFGFLYAFPTSHDSIWRWLQLVQILGLGIVGTIFYGRFRTKRIRANPERSAAVKSKFRKWESFILGSWWIFDALRRAQQLNSAKYKNVDEMVIFGIALMGLAYLWLGLTEKPSLQTRRLRSE